MGVAVGVALMGLFVFGRGVRSDTAVMFGVVTGTDNTLGAMRAFTQTEITKLSVSDNSRIQTDGNWAMTGAYDETKYLEFVFTPNISASASVSSVAINHEYYRSNALIGAKLEIWSSSSWHDVPISLPQTSGTAGEISQTLDITSLAPNSTILNSIKIRFLAYRSTAIQSGIKTSHDLIQLAVNYSTPTLTPSPTDSATLTPTPSDTISPTASASDIATPTPDVSVSPTPEITPPPTPISTPFIFLTPEPEVPPAPDDTPLPASVSFQSPSPSPTASPSFSPTPEATPSASFEITTNPLVAVIAPAKIIHRKIKTTPTPSAAPIIFTRSPSPVHQLGLVVMNIWHLFGYYVNMIRR